MNFDLSEEHQSFADSVRRFAADKLAPGALERAHSPHFPWDTARMLAEQGLFGIAFREEDGGQGGTLMHAVLAIQEVALVCPKSRTSCKQATSVLSEPSWSTPRPSRKTDSCRTCWLARN
jgi:alkylation response protein AidB-like acyl-CoA dehydrogenase